MTKKPISFGEFIRALRENENLPLRKIAAHLDIDPSLLGKIERNERTATKEIIIGISKFFKQDEKVLMKEFISDQIANKIIEEKGDIDILKIAERKIQYLMSSKI